MSRLNLVLSGVQITDEVINRSTSTASKLAHDTIRNGGNFEIWTGAGKTGSKLGAGEYTLNGEDADYTAEVGVPVYTTLSIVNGARHNVDLYVTYKTCGDYTSVENIKEIAQDTIAGGNLGEITGTATFTKLTNNIELPKIGEMGLEIGDVITVSGSTNNNKEFTVEFLTDANNIIVNYEHRNGTTSKSLIQETTANVTVKLLAKWYNAPLGLGQAWVNVTALKSAKGVNFNSPYENRRLCGVYVWRTDAAGVDAITIDDELMEIIAGGAAGVGISVALTSQYSRYFMHSVGGGAVTCVKELR